MCRHVHTTVLILISRSVAKTGWKKQEKVKHLSWRKLLLDGLYCCFIGRVISLFAVFWIRIGFNAHPDPALHLNADPDPDPDPGSQTNADQDPDLFQTLKAQKFEFLHETYSVPTYSRE